jgi:multisubunit Na+/H+ antiporter MnhF subunit
MADGVHPAAIQHLPFFLPGPDGSDTLFTVMTVFLIVVLFLFGTFYLRLHSLPEQLAHGASKVQLQLVGVLGLLALFTHNHVFWVAALLIALVPFPDFARPLYSMAESLERLAGGPAPAAAAPSPSPVEPVATTPVAAAASAPDAPGGKG